MTRYFVANSKPEGGEYGAVVRGLSVRWSNPRKSPFVRFDIISKPAFFKDQFFHMLRESSM
jgi:hypothetical protein